MECLTERLAIILICQEPWFTTHCVHSTPLVMNTNAYELPSIYRHTSVTDSQEAEEEEVPDALSSGLVGKQQEFSYNRDREQARQNRALAWLLLFTPLSMLIFTLIPVVADLPNVEAMTTGDAIWRLFDPVSITRSIMLPCSNMNVYNTSAGHSAPQSLHNAAIRRSMSFTFITKYILEHQTLGMALLIFWS